MKSRTIDPVKEGRKGGNATKKKYGKEFFVKIARRRWKKAKKLRAQSVLG